MNKCPFCGSDMVDVDHDENLLRSFYFCAECGNEWSRAGINRKGPATPKRKNPFIIPIICILIAFFLIYALVSAINDSNSENEGITSISSVSSKDIEKADASENDKTLQTGTTETVDLGNIDTEDIEDDLLEETTAEENLPKDDTTEATIVEEKEGNIEITMLNVGQGLSILIHADDEYMLYDGGGRKASSYVVSYLKKHDITNLKYLIASHYDEDHIAGLVGVLNTTEVDTALTPDYEADTDIYQSFIRKIDENDVDVIHPALEETFSLGNSEFTIIGPDDYSTSDDNNNSIAIRGILNDFSYIITGDAEEIEEFDIMNHDFDLNSTLYVVGHHGSESSSGYDFLQEINPEYVFISVGEGNTYSHPAKSTMLRLKDADVKMYRSDKQGEVTISSDGHTWKANKKKCKDWSDGSVQEEKVIPVTKTETKKESEKAEVTRNSSEEESTSTYILNTNTKKFHYPYCKSVKQMKDSNKQEVDSTRDEIISWGYSSCGNCHP